LAQSTSSVWHCSMFCAGSSAMCNSSVCQTLLHAVQSGGSEDDELMTIDRISRCCCLLHRGLTFVVGLPLPGKAQRTLYSNDLMRELGTHRRPCFHCCLLASRGVCMWLKPQVSSAGSALLQSSSSRLMLVCVVHTVRVFAKGRRFTVVHTQ
jgi:hypothetical protein